MTTQPNRRRARQEQERRGPALPARTRFRRDCAASISAPNLWFGVRTKFAFDVFPEEDFSGGAGPLEALLALVPAEEDHRDHDPEVEAADDLHDQPGDLLIRQRRPAPQPGHVLVEVVERPAVEGE